jgi:hypothetical protein
MQAANRVRFWKTKQPGHVEPQPGCPILAVKD